MTLRELLLEYVTPRETFWYGFGFFSAGGILHPQDGTLWVVAFAILLMALSAATWRLEAPDRKVATDGS